MQVVLMHFHLKPGGVTTVIRQQAELLRKAGHEVLLVTGETPEADMPAAVQVVPGLAYDDRPADPALADRIAREILATLKTTLPHLIHVHNPTLAKNRNLQMVLKLLQKDGVPLLCQIHDLAEDGRPGHFFTEPYVADCHYATVNGRDREILIKSGLSEQGVHHLPNAVVPLPLGRAEAPAEAAPVLYPVRAIRRKNIGEAILLHLMADRPAPLAITLPPNSQRDMAGYRLWRRFVAHNGLDVTFEAGLSRNFADLVAACRYVLTTSITEGFGFSYLDPWPAGKALWGRRLADICVDFTHRGIRLDHLYDQIRVPLSFIDVDRLRQAHTTALTVACRNYGRPLGESDLALHWQAFSDGETIDFGMLDESFQQPLLSALLSNDQWGQALKRHNPFLEDPGPPAQHDDTIRSNADSVVRHFNTADYGCRLSAVYDAVLDQPVRHHIDKRILLDHFMAPSRFTLLKWGGFNG